jgi:hypothetical protein
MDGARRAMSIRILIGLFIACVVLYVLSVPFAYDEGGTYGRVTAYKYCSNCGALYHTVALDGHPEDRSVVIEGWRLRKCEHDLHIVDIAGFLCSKCGAKRVTYLLGDKVVAETVQASEQEMCPPAEHEWKVDFPRKSSLEKHAGYIHIDSFAVRCCGILGALLIGLYLIAAVATSLTLRRDAAVTVFFVIRRSLTLSLLAAGAIVCGFVEIVMPTIRLVWFAKSSNVGPSVGELSNYALSSYWPILGMAAFTAVITALTVSIIFLLQQRRK